MDFLDVSIVDIDSYVFDKLNIEPIFLDVEDYKHRISRLLARINSKGLDHVIFYGDREHFSNIEYFTGFDCRFEEALFIVSKEGELNIIVGNEGVDASRVIPYKLGIHLYQEFSLQGQPREASMDLAKILTHKTKISCKHKIGIVGWKYFDERYFSNSHQMFDLPSYLLEIIQSVADKENIMNFTNEIIGLPNGIRMKLYSAKEVAIIERNSVTASTVILNIIKTLKEGETELQSSVNGRIDFTPMSVHGVVNFGEHNVRIGLRSPGNRTLQEGDLCGFCYGVRGSLTARNGVAAVDYQNLEKHHGQHAIEFFKNYWKVIASWYEIVKLNANGGNVYNEIKSAVTNKKLNMDLNPGHCIGTDEWPNTPFFKDSTLHIQSGSLLQCDIICTKDTPFMSAICEDTVVIADCELRNSIKELYPAVAKRIELRQEKLRNFLGINIDDSLLPMSNMNAIFFPFMLDTGRVFIKAKEAKSLSMLK